MDNETNIQQVADELHSLLLISPLSNASYETLEHCLAGRIDTLIKNDFHTLIQLLYKMDISENKLRVLLQSDTDDIAANLIAKLMIERQLQKIETRRSFQKDGNIPEDEKW